MTAPPAEPAGPQDDGGDDAAGPSDPPGPPGFHLDGRLYAHAPQNWRAAIKRDFAKQYCHQKAPGEDYYHLLTGGELYLDDGERKLCLNCAVRAGVLTTDRFHWRREPRPAEIRLLPGDD